MLWLYDEFETDFTYNGIVLNNAYDSDIHWVLNTMYKLTFKYPTVDNDLYSFIEKGMIVKADEHDRTNLFRIKDIDISENDKCITVTAYQKNYDFSKRLVNNFGRLRVNCMSVLDEWYSNFLSSEKDFSYYSDINAINSFVSHNDDTDNKLRTSFELLGRIADTYSADIDMHDKQISLLERLGRDTEEVLTTAKNISEFVNTSNSDEIVTRIYASSTFKVGDKYDKKDLREQHRQQLKALRESQKEYSQGRNAVKKAQQMKDEIAKRYAKELAKNNKKVKRSGKVIKSYSQIESEVNAKYQARERKSQQRKAESQAIADRKKAEIESLKAQQKEELEALDEEITINLIVESPLINDYPFINEIAVSNNDLRTAEELEEWAMEYFTKQNIDKPKNSIKVTYEQLSEDINRGDTVILKYLKYGVDERIRVVETHYDPMLKKWKEFILGEKEGRLGSEVSSASSGAIAKANAYTDIITMDIERKVKERSENYDKLFKKNTDEINKKIEDGFEKAKASSEVTIAKIDEDLEKKLAPIRNQVSTTVENYNRQFQATNLEISKNRVEATKQIKALSDRVSNIQDISNNETVVELRGLVNGATSKVTELQDSITREFTAVKKKNEDSLNAVKAEFTKGVDGLTSKITSLEEYKNQDGSRTETLKQWVQRDTASQLSRERTEINRIIDNKGFVKNTEFSSKFTESARGITNQLSALETYKNQDGARTANLQIWVQNNTANQLTAARRSIESWVNEKGYATTSVVENKVQETANSFSREISNVRNSIPTSVGGRNYIPNSNFAKDFKNWEDKLTNSGLQYDKGHALKHFGRGLHIWGTPNNLHKGFSSVPFDLTAEQGEKLTLSMDLGKDFLNNYSILDVRLHYMDGDTILSQELQKIDLATQGFVAKKYKRISKVFTVPSNITKCRVMIYAVNGQTANFYIDNIKLEKGNIATDWTPAPEDDQQSINELNSWKQTANQTLNTVTSTLNDTVRHSQLQITADSINFGSNKVFNGRNLASMLSVSPDSIKAITDRLVITPTNENLVLPEHRDIFILNVRNGFLNKIYGSNTDLEGEYQFKISIIDFDTPTLNASIHVKYKDGTDSWFNSEFPTPSIATLETSTSVKVQVESRKEIEYIEPLVFQNKWSDFYRFHLKKLFVGKKKSAELIVDGSIEGRHVKTNTLETGHHKAGSITSEIIAAKAVKIGHLLVDDAMIDEFVAHKAFINKLWAQDAFIKSLQTVKIKSTQLDTDWLSAYTGDIGGFRIGKNPNEPGDFWLTGSNNFNCGLNPGHNIGTRGAQIWAAWGNNWYKAGPNAWYVNGNGNMVSNATAVFNRGLDVHGRHIYTHDQDIYGQGAGSSNTSVIWWSQINRVKSSVSDRRFKTNIKPTKVKAVDLLNKIEMVEFSWKKDGKFEKIGAIAQQVQSVEKSLVVKDMDSKQSYSDYLRISYYDTIPYLIKAVQELSEENKELKNKLEEIING
nr:MAG TPA: tail protein [Caudoviricetes sp.]